MAVNKVEINGEVKLDLTQDTVTAARLAQGETAHDASGELIIGTMSAPQLQIVVTTSAGATVTATKGSKTVSGTADASGNCTLTVDETGEWLLTVSTSQYTATANVTVGTNVLELYPGPVCDPVFANNDWATIVAACQTKTVPTNWKVGDSKVMTVTGAGDIQVDIIGKNHDDYADGSGKAPLTLQFHKCIDYGKMNSSAGNSMGWKSCTMRTTTMANALKWIPADLRSAVRAVTKKTASKGNSSTAAVTTTSDKMFLLSEVEVLGTTSQSVSGEGTQYEYYKTVANQKKVSYQSTSTVNWWLRSPRRTDATSFLILYFNGTKGSASDSYANNSNWTAPAFCF